MENGHEKNWNTVWSRRNSLSRLVDYGRKIYNLFFFKLIKRYLTKQSSMLELGCGTSTLSLMVATEIKELIGLDISEEALKISEANARSKNISNMKFIKGDCTNVPYENRFDFVWSQGLIEHFDNPESIVREHFKATKTGGITLIAVPYLYSYMYIWWLVTRSGILRKFWPWTDQIFFTKKTLGEIGKRITPNSRVFLLKPFFLGIVLLEMKK